jgi:hypothetical protein
MFTAVLLLLLICAYVVFAAAVAASGAQTYIPGQWPSGVNRVVSNVLS